jgi:hypothetical protein
VWFGIIERQAIHRGAFPSVRDLMIKIRAFINGWNDRCQPFVWTKTADQILTKANQNNFSFGPLGVQTVTQSARRPFQIQGKAGNNRLQWWWNGDIGQWEGQTS